MLIPLLIAESLGLRRYDALTGITSISATIGSTLGPLVAGRVFDVTHSYTSAFELFIAINVIGALVTFASTSYEKERSREKERPPMTPAPPNRRRLKRSPGSRVVVKFQSRSPAISSI